MRSVIAGLFALVVLSAATAPSAGTYARERPVVAAASDLQFALTEIAEAFARETGERVELTFGSSGNFARQIREGAPYELYFSADEDYVLGLASEGFTRDVGSLYAIGRIVLIVPHGSPLVADGTLDDLAQALADGRVTHFAIANPEHAPYGRRAEEALRSRGLWEAIAPKLVLGENVSQAAQFAASGNAQGGIVAYALALAPAVAALASHVLIPENWHSPLRQRMVLLRDAGPTAVRFHDYVRQDSARAILARHGFVLPQDMD